MTAQFRQSMDLLQGKKKGLGVWIVGSGTSLDDIDLKKLEGQDILSLNASIELTVNLNADVWWCYYDMRTYREVYPRIDVVGNKPLKVYVHRRGCEQMREFKRDARFVVYKDGEFKPQRTVLETALMIAEYLGYEEAYLLGIDAFAFSESQRPYAKPLDWKHCYFAEAGKEGSWQRSQKSFINSMRELESKLAIDVYRVSDLFPDDGPFKKETLESCLAMSGRRWKSWNRKNR